VVECLLYRTAKIVHCHITVTHRQCHQHKWASHEAFPCGIQELSMLKSLILLSSFHYSKTNKGQRNRFSFLGILKYLLRSSRKNQPASQSPNEEGFRLCKEQYLGLLFGRLVAQLSGWHGGRRGKSMNTWAMLVLRNFCVANVFMGRHFQR